MSLQLLTPNIPAIDCGGRNPLPFSHSAAEVAIPVALPRVETASVRSKLALAGRHHSDVFAPRAIPTQSKARPEEARAVTAVWTSTQVLDERVIALAGNPRETDPDRIPPVAGKQPYLIETVASKRVVFSRRLHREPAHPSHDSALRPGAPRCAAVPQLEVSGRLFSAALESAFRRARQIPAACPDRQSLPAEFLRLDPSENTPAPAPPVIPSAAVPPARLRFGSLHTLDSKKLVDGPRQQLIWLEPEVVRAPKCARPVVHTGSRTQLTLSGRLPVPIPTAKWGHRCVSLPLDQEAPAPFLVAPKSIRKTAIDFNPPQFGKRPTHIAIPRCDLKKWISPLQAECLPAPVAPRQYSGRRTRTLCDWVPVATPLLPLSVRVDIQNIPAPSLRPQPGHSPLSPPASLLPATPFPVIPPARWKAKTTRLSRLSIDRIVPVRSSSRPEAVSIPEVQIPGIRTLNTGFGLRRSRRDVIGAIPPSVWEENLERAKAAWQNLGTLPRWAAIAVITALLVGALAPGRNPFAGNGEEGTAQASFSGQWDALKTHILKRAAVALTDDFRNGLSEWEGKGDWAQDWSYDAAGFVRPGPLALLTPSQEMTDYRMELLGQIEKKSIGWVVRAANADNYYAIKLIVYDPSPVPQVAIQRYRVIDGKSGPVRTKRLPIEVRNDTVYRIGTEVRGNNFVLTVQDQVVDSWTDDSLPSGGIGLFSAKGEISRVRWIGVWHQYDMLGRLCAYLAPPVLQDKQKEE